MQPNVARKKTYNFKQSNYVRHYKEAIAINHTLQRTNK